MSVKTACKTLSSVLVEGLDPNSQVCYTVDFSIGSGNILKDTSI